MTEYLTLPIGKMSLGMKQHVLLAAYLISDSSVMLFDEPLNGLDPGSIDILNSLIRQWQKEGRRFFFLPTLSRISNRFVLKHVF